VYDSFVRLALLSWSVASSARVLVPSGVVNVEIRLAASKVNPYEIAALPGAEGLCVIPFSRLRPSKKGVEVPTR
jgi:hypothetical protein